MLSDDLWNHAAFKLEIPKRLNERGIVKVQFPVSNHLVGPPLGPISAANESDCIVSRDWGAGFRELVLNPDRLIWGSVVRVSGEMERTVRRRCTRASSNGRSATLMWCENADLGCVPILRPGDTTAIIDLNHAGK